VANPYPEGNFAPVLVERTDEHPLPVTGLVPPDLDGRLLRIGPNRIRPSAVAGGTPWPAGDGMVHAVSLAGGVATGYRNRWVRTRRLSATLGTAPPHGPAEPLDGRASSHVVRHGGVTLALSDSAFPVALSHDLEHATVHDFDGDLASPMCAHPRVDPETGELVFFGTDVFGPPFLRAHVADGDGRLVRTDEIELPRAVYMHDFGITATRLVFFDLPQLADVDLMRAGSPRPFHWHPDLPARVGVLPRGSGNLEARWLPVDPCMVSHILNCFDDGDALVIDAIRHEASPDDPPGTPGCGTRSTLVRWTVDPDRGRVECRQLDDTTVEYPRVDDAVVGRTHRFGYVTALERRDGAVDFPAVIQYDLGRGRAVRYEPGAGRSVSEAVFVRADEGRADDEGWVLVVVYDAARDASDLVILDGTAFAGPPVGVVHLPARIPFGFHGSWVPTGS
jgi:carotenoid cleavage dioxygenase